MRYCTCCYYKIPKAFYYDHLYRGCGDTDNIVHETKTYYILDLSEETYADLVSDCEYYADKLVARELGADYRAIVASAKATLKALTRTANTNNESKTGQRK